ncbi:MAG: AmmeMemoRadiSam system radical SAM enzyme, partial [Thiohalomonadales bacterium]
IKHETQVWLEITTLLIPGKNDSDAELDAMTQWIAQQLGADVPLHFSAFHPDWKMQDIPATPIETLLNARKIAKSNGLRHVYIGNVHHKQASSSYCPHCGQCLIGREQYVLSDWNLDATGHCTQCGHALAGRFDAQPGSWGARRLPVEIATG